MTKAAKIFTVRSTYSRTGRISENTGTMEELLKAYSYTLEVGRCYESEKGNKKINCAPKTVKSLVTNLNNAVNNSAANGCAAHYYTQVE